MRRAYNSPPEAKSEKSVNFSATCDLCDDTGFRPVVFKGLPAVTRCVCKGAPPRLPGVDYKSLAAGEQ